MYANGNFMTSLQVEYNYSWVKIKFGFLFWSLFSELSLALNKEGLWLTKTDTQPERTLRWATHRSRTRYTPLVEVNQATISFWSRSRQYCNAWPTSETARACLWNSIVTQELGLISEKAQILCFDLGQMAYKQWHSNA